jgi:hypothetical protein
MKCFSRSNATRSSVSFKAPMPTRWAKKLAPFGEYARILFYLKFFGGILHTPSSCGEGRQANKIWIRFLYDGTRINEDDTPGSLDMDDNGMAFFL